MQNGTGGATDAASRCNRLRPFMSRNPRFLATKPRSGTACERLPQKGNLRPGIFLTRSPCVCRVEGKIAPIRARTRFRGQKRAIWPHETERHTERRPQVRCLAKSQAAKPFGETNAKAGKRRGPPANEETSERRTPAPKAAPSAKRAPSPQVRRRIARGGSSSTNPFPLHADAIPRRAGAYPHRTPARAIPSAPLLRTRSQDARLSTCGGGVPPRPTRRAKRRRRAKDGS